MRFLVTIAIFAISSVSFAETPQPPSEAIVAAACKVSTSAVSRTVKLPDADPSLKDKMIWIATYTFDQPAEFQITMACVPHGRFKDESFAAIAGRPELEYKKIELSDGGIIHHNLGDRGDQGAFYSTALITKSGPFDYTLLISRKPEVKDEDLPINFNSSGVALIQQFTKQ